jgi:transcriptional regulator with XRE-family HTH domain
MKSPDARSFYNSSPDYLHSLIERAGISQREAARRLGISDRSLRYYLAGQMPVLYTVQFALECLPKAVGDTTRI